MKGAAAKLFSRLAASLDDSAARQAPVAGRWPLEALLRAHLGPHQGGPPGDLFHVSLREIRMGFGFEWDHVGEKVMGMAEQVIGQTVPAGTPYCPDEDDGFLLVLADDDRERSRQKARRVLTALRRKLDVARVTADGRRAIALRAVTLNEVLKVRAPKPISAAPPEARAAAPEISAGQLAERIHRQIHFLYRPVWTSDGDAIDAGLCLARRTADYGAFTGKWVLNGGYHDPFAFGVDLRAMDSVLSHMAATRDQDRRPLLVLPLHIQSLLGSSRDKMVQMLTKRTDEDDRQRLVFELIGPADPLTLHKLPPLVGCLARLGCEVWLRALHNRVEEVLPHLRGVSALGIDLNDLARNDLDMSQRRQVLQGFADSLGAAGGDRPRAYVWDVRTQEEAQLARDAGAEMLAGEAIMADSETPRRRVALPRQRLGLGTLLDS